MEATRVEIDHQSSPLNILPTRFYNEDRYIKVDPFHLFNRLLFLVGKVQPERGGQRQQSSLCRPCMSVTFVTAYQAKPTESSPSSTTSSAIAT